jgi:hypothetical protein
MTDSPSRQMISLSEKFTLDGDTLRCTECERSQHVSWGNDDHGFVHSSSCSCSDPNSVVPEKPWRLLVDLICKASGYVPDQSADPRVWKPTASLHAHGDQRVPPLGISVGQQLHIDVRWTSVHSYRWHPYKPSSSQFQHGFRGRWQKAGEYAGWDNAPLPDGEWTLNEEKI